MSLPGGRCQRARVLQDGVVCLYPVYDESYGAASILIVRSPIGLRPIDVISTRGHFRRGLQLVGHQSKVTTLMMTSRLSLVIRH